MPVSAYTAEERGETNTDSYKVFVKDNEGVYWDILYPNIDFVHTSASKSCIRIASEGS